MLRPMIRVALPLALILACDASYYVEIEGRLTTSGHAAKGARILLLGGAPFAEIGGGPPGPMAVANAEGLFKVKYGGLNKTPRPSKLVIDYDGQAIVLSPGEDFSFTQPTRRLWHVDLTLDLATQDDAPLQVSCTQGKCTTLVSQARSPDFCYPSLYVRNGKVPSFASIGRIDRELLGGQVKFEFEVPDGLRSEQLILIVDCHDEDVFLSEPFASSKAEQ